jgi:hypothetical protein
MAIQVGDRVSSECGAFINWTPGELAAFAAAAAELTTPKEASPYSQEAADLRKRRLGGWAAQLRRPL